MIENGIIVANVYSGPMPFGTQQWIADSFPEGQRFQMSKAVPLSAGRNSMIRDVMLPALASHPDIDWCFFIDNDVTITYPGIDRFLLVEADIVSCGCKMPSDTAWETEDAFHDHFWKCRPLVLHKIPPPWFEQNLSEDGCDLLGCDCQTFSRKVKQAGLRIAHGGWCSHANARTCCGAGWQ
jgi:hypothetical protein